MEKVSGTSDHVSEYKKVNNFIDTTVSYLRTKKLRHRSLEVTYKIESMVWIPYIYTFQLPKLPTDVPFMKLPRYDSTNRILLYALRL